MRCVQRTSLCLLFLLPWLALEVLNAGSCECGSKEGRGAAGTSKQSLRSSNHEIIQFLRTCRCPGTYSTGMQRVSSKSAPNASGKKTTSTTSNPGVASTPVVDGDVIVTSPSAMKPLDPVAVFEDWKISHSAEALRKDGSNLSDRKFIVGWMSCPRKAGILASDFTNALLLAVATNRTFLFRYDGMKGMIKNGENAPEVCEKVLHRADWIPLLDEFKDQLEPVMKNKTYVHFARESFEKNGSFEIDRGFANAQVVEYVRSWGLGSIEGIWYGIMNLTETQASAFYSSLLGVETPFADDERVHSLYAEGVYFLYGMLYSQSFSLTTGLLESVEEDLALAKAGDEETVFSIAMHSRHTDAGDTGADIQNEKACLNSFITQDTKNRTCRLYLMSDREATLSGVMSYAKGKHNCQVVMASSRAATKLQVLQEHGPFAGMGYFQDLAVVSQAKSAFMSKSRSSSALVGAIMEFNRRMYAWSKDGTRDLPGILLCEL